MHCTGIHGQKDSIFTCALIVLTFITLLLTHISPNYVIITHLPPLYFVEARMYERHAKQMRRYQTELDSSRQCGPKKAFLVHKQTVRNVNETSHESFLFKLACLI